MTEGQFFPIEVRASCRHEGERLVRVVSERLENVPARTGVSQHIRTPWGGHPEQWYFKS